MKSSKKTPKLQVEIQHPEWNDWHWQMVNRIREGGVACENFPMAVTPYYASLIEKWDATDPVFCMAVPQVEEMIEHAQLEPDPLEEDLNRPVPNVIRRYVDRAVILATTNCAVRCRHCDRKRMTGAGEGALSDGELREITRYLQMNRDIKDVIISGGDPLTLSDARLENVISAVHGAGSVEMIRIGTRVPVTMPMRITDELCEMLAQYHPLYINTHFNHPRELTEEAANACAMLAGAGIQLGNQSVLLRGVNDDADTLEALSRGLLRIRVKPYYLFHCEPVPGTAHLRVPVSKGMALMDQLRNRIGGMGLPSYVLDTEDKGGKIPLTPERVLSVEGELLLKTNDGRVISHPEALT